MILQALRPIAFSALLGTSCIVLAQTAGSQSPLTVVPPLHETQQARRLLPRFTAQTALVRLSRIVVVREEQYVMTAYAVHQMQQRIQKGVGRGVDLEYAVGMRIDAEIALDEAVAELQDGIERYRERFGQGPDVLKLQQPELRASLPVAMPEAAADGSADALAAWLRVDRAAAAVPLHASRAARYEKVYAAFRQQFDNGARSLFDLLTMFQNVIDARIEQVKAEVAEIDSQAALLALMGRLKEDDLPSATVAGRKVWSTVDNRPLDSKRIEELKSRRAPQPADAPPSLEPEPRSDELLPPRSDLGRPRLFNVANEPEPGAGREANLLLRQRNRDAAKPAAACGAEQLGSTATIGGSIPKLAWPPAPASYERNIPPRLVRADKGDTTLDHVAQRLTKALDDARYESAYAFLEVPNGFALVTRLEQIRTDGSPSSRRWSRDLPRAGDLGFREYLQALFRAPPGLYRVITFIVTDAVRNRSGQVLTSKQFDTLLTCGGNRLPPAIGKAEFGDGMRVDALIYEFMKPNADAPAEVVMDDRLRSQRTADVHLRNSGIWARLED